MLTPTSFQTVIIPAFNITLIFNVQSQSSPPQLNNSPISKCVFSTQLHFFYHPHKQ